MVYWYVKFIVSPEKKERSLKNAPYRKTLFRLIFGSFFISFGLALRIQNLPDLSREYIYISFPLISLSFPILMIIGFGLQLIAIEIYKMGHGGRYE